MLTRVTSRIADRSPSPGKATPTGTIPTSGVPPFGCTCPDTLQEIENRRPALKAAAGARGQRVVRPWNFDGNAWRGDYKSELAEPLKAAQRREFRWLVSGALTGFALRESRKPRSSSGGWNERTRLGRRLQQR